MSRWPRCQMHGPNAPIATHEISWGYKCYPLCKKCLPNYEMYAEGEIFRMKVKIPKEMLQRLKASAMTVDKDKTNA